MEGWKNGRMEGERMKECKDGKMEGLRDGGIEE
jgi:hypothetical protein